MKNKKRRCKENWKLPYSSNHIWNGDIHGIPAGKCIKCGYEYDKYHKKFEEKLTKEVRKKYYLKEPNFYWDVKGEFK